MLHVLGAFASDHHHQRSDARPVRGREAVHLQIGYWNSLWRKIHDCASPAAALARLTVFQRNTRSQYIKNYDFDYGPTNSHYTMTAVSGHLTSHDFFDTHRKWHSCDPYDLFDANVKVDTSEDSKAIEQNLFSEARRNDMLMIWTDCDREGEHIGSEIAAICRRAKPNIQVKRARFSAIIAECVSI